jgi:hypothetical protein
VISSQAAKKQALFLSVIVSLNPSVLLYFFDQQATLFQHQQASLFQLLFVKVGIRCHSQRPSVMGHL